VAPLKSQLLRNDGGVWGGDPEGVDDVLVLRSTEQTIDGRWKIEEPAFRKLTKAERNSALLQEGDLLITKSSGSALHIGKTTLVDRAIHDMGCCYSNFMQRLRLRPTYLPKLAWHLLNNGIARSQFNLLSSSTTGLANLNGGVIGQIVVPIPPLPEQQAIATFLDRETARIDALVGEQQRLIALLTEKRQAVISHAVTKGLDPTVPMKDSGVAWLGEVPEHWGLTYLKHVTDQARPIMYGIVLPGPHVPGGVPIVKGGDVKPGRLNLETLNRTTVEIESGYVRSRLKARDIVVSIRGTVGEVELVPAEIEGSNLTQDAARVAPADGIDAAWLVYVLRAKALVDPLLSLSLGAAVRGINIRDLKRLCIVLPPAEERAAIATYLDRETTRIDALIADANQAITLLQERRTALITAAVTGQIDVRAHAEALPA
jgi:type I restriction enzyme S subunit